MRLAQHKLLPRNERTRVRVPANYSAMYLQRRRRARITQPFNSPHDISGLKLWLDAGVGLSGLWGAAPASGSVWIDYSSSAGHTADNNTHGIHVYAFKTVESERVYSARYVEVQTTDDGSSNLYYINWSWDAVAGAEGYRVLKSDPANGQFFDYYVDVFSTSFIDTGSGMFSGGASLAPQFPVVEEEAGDVVQLWNDQSGLNNHATGLGTGQYAVFQPGVVNGRPVLRFDSIAGYTTPLVLNTPCTVFAVYALNGAGDLARRAVQGTNNWLIGPYGPPHEFFNGAAFSGGPALTRGVFVAQAAWQNGSIGRNFVDGSFVAATIGGGWGPGTLGLGVGGAYVEGLDGDIAEVIAYDSALTDSQLANVWSYLAAKYALS